MRFYHTLRTFVVAAVLAILFAGCDLDGFTDAVDDFQLILGYGDIDSPFVIKVIDSETGELITDDVRAEFLGDGASVLVDEYGDPISSLVIKNGVGTFGLANSIEPKRSEPLTFRIRATTDRFRRTFSTVRLSHTGQHQLTARMERLGRALQGSATATVRLGEADQSGRLSSTFSISTPTEPVSGGRATVQLPGGALAQTAAGAPVSGRLTTTLTYFNPMAEESRRAFPGGFEAPVVDETGADLDRRLVSYTYATVDVVDAQGNRVQSLSEPAAMVLSLPTGYIYPFTGRRFEGGDSLDIHVFDLERGVWTRESGGRVIRRRGGRFFVEFETTDLGPVSAGLPFGRCNAGMQINFEGSAPTSIRLFNRMYDEMHSVPTLAEGSSMYDASFRVPTGPALDYRIQMADGRIVAGTADNPCSGVDVTVPAPQKLVSVRVTGFEEPCHPDKLAVGIEGSYSFIYAAVRFPEAGWESATAGRGHTTVDGPVLQHETGVIRGNVGTTYRMRGQFASFPLTGTFTIPVDAVDGQQIEATIDTAFDRDDICE